MKLKSLRLIVFGKLLKPFQSKHREKRMKRCSELMGLDQQKNILDLGGKPEIWDTVNEAHNIIFLNLPGELNETYSTHHNAQFMVGDACDVKQFEDKKFDLVFSNSVIEHVGDREKIKQFVNEVKRLGQSYWIQTPAKIFPIEAHCGMPFWWYYPESLRQFFIKRWKKKVPAWTEMVEGTTVLSKTELRELFPEATFITEWSMGFPKSYSVFYLSERKN